MKTTEIKQQILKLLHEGKELTVRWDCGGDEAFAYPAIDGKELEYENEFGQQLADFISDKLNLPSAGEFYLKGGGKIFIEGNTVVIEHKSVGAGVMDYDEEKEEAIYSEEEEESGKNILFPI